MPKAKKKMARWLEPFKMPSSEVQTSSNHGFNTLLSAFSPKKSHQGGVCFTNCPLPPNRSVRLRLAKDKPSKRLALKVLFEGTACLTLRQQISLEAGNYFRRDSRKVKSPIEVDTHKAMAFRLWAFVPSQGVLLRTPRHGLPLRLQDSGWLRILFARIKPWVESIVDMAMGQKPVPPVEHPK